MAEEHGDNVETGLRQFSAGQNMIKKNRVERGIEMSMDAARILEAVERGD